MTLNRFYKLYNIEIEKAVISALREDGAFRDITTGTVLKSKSAGKKITARLLCKQDCTAAGLFIFKKVYSVIDPRAAFKFYYKDGDFIRNKQTAIEVKSSLKNLLVGERVALNFLQKMSGIATLTKQFVKMLKFKNAKILHTRKTTPGFRLFEAAAVKTGGGDFHRLSLGSAVLIKDNHIIAAGSVKNALEMFRNKKPVLKNIEIEVKTFREILQVLQFGPGLVKTVMLDNFNESDIDRAVTILKLSGFYIELSGGINKSNFKKIQRKGIDYYSIGMLTHSYSAVDFSLEF